MEPEKHSGVGIAGMADLMDVAQATVHPESAQLHGVIANEASTQECSAALVAARADGFTPVILLGQGGSADVWRCADEGLAREIAVKIIRPDGLKTSEACQALLRFEAELLGKLSHPGIVHAIKHADEGDASYLAMQFVDGDDLFLHCQVAELDLNQRLRLFGRVLDVVVYLHGKGVVHGDLKPDHILIREGGHPVLIDFGLAARWQYAEQVAASSLRVGGSGPYRPPEVASGQTHRPDPKQDVYALGVILRELTESVDANELGHAIEGLCDQATATNPDQRLPDAAAMQRVLKQIQVAHAVDGQPGQANTHERRLPARLITAAVLVCMLILIAIGSAWLPVAGRDQDPLANEAFLSDQRPRGTMHLTQRAVVLEGVLSEARRGQFGLADERLQPVLEQHAGKPLPWEVRHLQARADGRGLVLPYTEDPYEAPFAIDTAYDPHSSTLAYVLHRDQDYEVWARREDGRSALVTRTPNFVQAVVVAPSAKKVAGLISGGAVAIWTTPSLGDFPTLPASREPLEGDEPQTAEWVLPRERNAKKVWFNSDGSHLLVFALATGRVECWPLNDDQAVRPVWAIDGCDQAYSLASGQGQFIVATRQDDGPTLLRRVGQDGKIVDRIELENGGLPVSADALPGAKSLICLGMPNGYVRMHDPDRGWLEPCDLGANQAVTAVLYSPAESRVFAGMGRVHVLNTDGELVMRLGDRDAPPQLITSLHGNPQGASVTGVSLKEVWRWACPPPMN